MVGSRRISAKAVADHVEQAVTDRPLVAGRPLHRQELFEPLLGDLDQQVAPGREIFVDRAFRNTAALGHLGGQELLGSTLPQNGQRRLQNRRNPLPRGNRRAAGQKALYLSSGGPYRSEMSHEHAQRRRHVRTFDIWTAEGFSTASGKSQTRHLYDDVRCSAI